MRFLSLSLESALDLVPYARAKGTDWFYKLWACFQDPDLVLLVDDNMSIHQNVILYWIHESAPNPAHICKTHTQTAAILEAYPALMPGFEPGSFWRVRGGSISNIYDLCDPITRKRLASFLS